MKPNADSTRPYFLALLLLASALSIFYYFYLKYYGGIYFVHYYEYYTRAVVVTDFLKKLDFSSALHHYLHSYVDKILLVRTVPFFLLFGSSQFVFFYSNVFFNLFLLLILFHSLLKIMEPSKAFYLTLLILSQYFFIELLASFYVDLSIFLVCALFFIYLSLFDKKPHKYNGRLIFIVFLLFLTKNASYILIPVLGILFVIYFILSKKKRMVYVLRFSIILGIGFLIYYIFVLGFNYQIFMKNMHGATGAFIPEYSRSLTELIGKVSNYIYTKGLSTNLDFVNKFPFFWLNLLIYPIVLFTHYKKRNHFWIFLFLVSEVFFFFLYNIRSHPHTYRYMLPFYFVYLYFIYDLTTIIFDKITRKNYTNKLFALIITIFLLTSFIKLMDPEQRALYSCHDDFFDFSSYIPIKSRIYIDNNSNSKVFYQSFIDQPKNDFFYLSKIDPRFKYRVINSAEGADYAVYKDRRLNRSAKEYELITIKDGYCLSRIK